MVYVLLMMGGSGVRLGANIPKQFIEVEGTPIFSYIVQSLEKMDEIDGIVIVVHKDWIEFVNNWRNASATLKKVAHIVPGGDTRSESVLNGLYALSGTANNDDIVLIHDSTHPYVDEDGTRAVIEGVKKYGGATLASFPYDTCYQMNENRVLTGVIPRTKLAIGASPEAFRFGQILSIYSNASREELNTMTSAGAIALAHNIDMVVVPANLLNLKITYQEDIELFEKLAHGYFFD